MKIALDVSQAIYGTGVSVYTRQLVTQLTKITAGKHQLVLFGGSLRRKRELDDWISRLPAGRQVHPDVINKTHYLPPRLLHWLWNNFHLVNAEVFTGPVDLLHTSDWAEPPARAPKVTTVHDLSFFKDPSFVQPVVRQAHLKRLYWVAKESAKIIAVSQATKRDLIKYLNLPADRIEVIYEGPSVADAPPAVSPPTHPYFFVPGCGHPRKNIARIVAATARFRPDYRLVIAGRPTPTEQTLSGPDIIFTGHLTDADWGKRIAAAALLLYPSLYEGFGIPILDAFVCNTPVVTSNTSSLPEVAGKAAVLVDPMDAGSICAGISQALGNKSALIKAGQQRLPLFSWEKTAHETLNLYETVTAYRN